MTFSEYPFIKFCSIGLIFILFSLHADQVSTTIGSDGKSYVISGHWDPTDPTFQILNTETPKGNRIFIFQAPSVSN